MTHTGFNESFKRGVVFIREHPQVWSTAFVGIAIISSFLYISLKFASIAQNAQQQLFNDRAGWMLDSFTLFAADVIDDRETLTARMSSLMEINEPIESMFVVVPQGTNEWQVYAAPDERSLGTVVFQSDADRRFMSLAWGDPSMSYTTIVGEQNERRFRTARAIRNAKGKVVALAITTLRLTEADRQIRENLMQSYALLAGVLVIIMVLFVRHARIVDYATLYRKQLEIDEMKDSFIGMASHELKSPLTVIRGYIEYLREGTVDEPTRQEFMRRIDVAADELRQLIDDILDVSRIEMGRLRFSPDYVDPILVLNEVADMFKVQAQGKGLTLSLVIEKEAEGQFIRVDRGRLKQVMVNLASNAIKYTLTGNVYLEAHVVHANMELAVRDTGVGMTAEEQHKLFGKFYRVEAKETRGVAGTGLGLWITKYITEKMGGSISVESMRGQGSRFVVTFPLREEEGSKGVAAPKPADSPPSTASGV